MNGPVRPGIPGGIANSNMLAIGNPPFMQNPVHMSQQPMGLPQNMNAPNPPMGMLSGGPAPPVTQRYTMQQSPMPQHQLQPQRQMLMRQGPNPPQLTSAAGGPSAAHVQAQLQGMHFPGNTLQQPQGSNNAVRRAQSQPQINPLSGMPGSVGPMPMGLNPQTSMPAHLRQAQAHQHQLRLQQQQQQQAIIHQAEMRRGPGPNQSMPPNMARTPSSQNQAMSSLGQPSSIGSMSHPSGMQPPHHQNPFQNGGSIPSQHPPAQLPSSPRPSQNHTPSMSMGTPEPSHTPINRARTTPDNSNMSFMGYTGSQFSGNNLARVPSNASSPGYPFVPPSSTSPNIQMDLSQPSSGMMHSQGGTPNRPTFMATPAQQFELMNSNSSMDLYSSPSFGMPPPSAVPPPRPPSHSTNPHQPPQQQSNSQPPLQPPQQPQQPQAHHQSPPSDQIHVHPQRPPSQPQQMMPGRPPSQMGTTRTPRSMQLPLPGGVLPGPLTTTGRLPMTQQTPLTPVSGMLPIAPRPPLAMGGVPAPPTASAQMAADAPPSVAPVQRAPALPSTTMTPGLVRLLQFSGVLSNETKTKLQLSWWNDLVKEYFTPKAMMKLTLWRDSQRTEAKPFEIGVPILPRFFLVTTQSGVKSMTFALDGARERSYAPGGQGHTVVECVSAIWTYKYTNGYTVTLRGPLTVHVIVTATVPPGNTQAPQYTLKFDDFQFDANIHDKYIALEAILGPRTIESPKLRNTPTPTPGSGQQQQQMEEDKRWEEPRVRIEHASIPGEPVNAFGIPQATMRCLELAESVSSMADLIAFAGETNLGPLDALKRYAAKIRDSQPLGGQHPQPMNNMPLNNTNTTLSTSFPSYTSHSSVTLYSSAPPSITNPQPPNPPLSINSPQNTPSSSTNSPEKQPKTIPQQAQTPQSGPASSPAVSSGGTTNTPAMANSSLKRKQGDASSPTVGNEHQPAKRLQKKRGRTGTTGAG
ncbi:hypothetical protein GALMADRAFT_250519 [Galerina marginata CBS 339.88]|uniref:Uncharacterized protein n=1 Tax=Galerina marginata (strain CBS 339.88) TaxID=685588 RepID=A0A067SWV6_GALM3|nr:hypothetical protein GALMADRAFT_250519 [Galerina marginata CBS 339.88]